MLTSGNPYAILNRVARHKSKIHLRGNDGSIAQLGEHLPYKQGVIGSSPIVPTTKHGLVVQLVRTLACHARGQGFESPSGRQLLRKQYFAGRLYKVAFFVLVCLGSSVGRAVD